MLNQIDLSRTDLNLLLLFEVVLAERHVGRAAAHLNLSPSAVSHGLGRLRRLLNDPLFLRTPKGVQPTTRALELAVPIADILARVRGVVAGAAPFDPMRSRRHFRVAAPDGVAAVFLPGVAAAVAREAPGIDLALRPMRVETALADLENRQSDLAVGPIDPVPARFAHETLFEESFVVAARADHPFLSDPSLDRYCGARHLLVSIEGGTHGYVDQELAKLGRQRRVVLTVPAFAIALSLLPGSDLLAALPSRLVALHGPRFGVRGVAAPLALQTFPIRVVAPRVALMDAGLDWLFRCIARVAPAG
ncbi:LysR substrate-binding domain-containing protein [Stella sp.]|uniref:LysR substrate-binding domain-containing protein n=1 Tax=Stella sp. TaxID=2912054 RepID=UPI0035AE4C5B